MAASATFALNAGLWLRRARLDIIAPDLRHPRRAQAEIPLTDLSEFAQPPLSPVSSRKNLWMVVNTTSAAADRSSRRCARLCACTGSWRSQVLAPEERYNEKVG